MLLCGQAYLIPPRVFSTLTLPMLLAPWALTFLSSSRLAGMTLASVSFRVGSVADAKPSAPIVKSFDQMCVCEETYESEQGGS
jgi:hypothetical protein